MIPNIDDNLPPSPLASPRSIYPSHPTVFSNPSSRDSSPGRSFSPIPGSPRPAMVIPRARRGFGFKMQAVPVYFGSTGNAFTLQHIVTVSRFVFASVARRPRLPWRRNQMLIRRSFLCEKVTVWIAPSMSDRFFRIFYVTLDFLLIWCMSVEILRAFQIIWKHLESSSVQ